MEMSPAVIVSGRKVALLLKLYRFFAGISQKQLASVMCEMFGENIKVSTISKFELGTEACMQDVKDFSLKAMVWLEIMGIDCHYRLVSVNDCDSIDGMRKKRKVAELPPLEKRALETLRKMCSGFTLEHLQLLEIIFGVTPEDLHKWSIQLRRRQKNFNSIRKRKRPQNQVSEKQCRKDFLSITAKNHTEIPDKHVDSLIVSEDSGIESETPASPIKYTNGKTYAPLHPVTSAKRRIIYEEAIENHRISYEMPQTDTDEDQFSCALL
uniref:uncharacterized protein LOC120342812 isoform X1 n=1 Tax=Styela clava TaxID=7725 RepID=UPI001939B339|nr:uncharacterized protein LOC120342812 isoform X1 [Styela clava]